VWATAIAVGAVVFGYGRLRLRDAPTMAGPSLRVGVVQANIALVEKRLQGVLAHRRHLEQTRELLDAGAVDLVVWPETAFVRGLRGPLPISGRPVVEDLAVPLIFGAPSISEDEGRRLTANSALLVDADGTIRSAYAKNLLIPLTEYVPFAAYVPGFERWFPHLQNFGAADETPALRLGAWRIATPICYEAVRADFVRGMVTRAETILLVTLGNDAWFGDSV
jgi:apolipoprotein N-acyltransferase